MTAPIRPDDPLLRLQYYKETGQDKEAGRYEQYLRETGQLGTRAGDPNAKIHAEFASGALQRRNAILNRNDQGTARDAASADTYTDRLGSMAERAASTLPGGSAVMTAERKLITGEPWNESANRVAEGAEEGGKNAPGVTIHKAIPLLGGSRITLADLPAAMAGGRALMRAAPALSLTKQGAVYGGALAATSPEDESVLGRVGNTALGAAGGAAIPAVMKGVSLGRTALKANKGPAFDANVVAREAARDAASTPLYEQFRQLPDLPLTPALQKIMDVPIVRQAIKAVQGRNAELTDLQTTHPKVLDAAYKQIGKQAAMDQYDPSVTLSHFGDAIEEAAQQHGGSYKAALDAFRVPSEQIEAVKRGNRAMQYSAAPKGAPVTAVDDSPAAFKQWATAPERTPEELAGAREGIRSRLKVEPKTAKLGAGPIRLPIPVGASDALKAAPGLLELTEPPGRLTRAARAFTSDPSDAIKDLVRVLLSGATIP